MDNKSTINLALIPVAHGKTKHIETRFHFLQDQVNKNKVKLNYCTSEMQIADLLTKSLKINRFCVLRDMVGVISVEILN